MQQDNIEFTASDGFALHVHCWRPDGPARAVVQIAHGMAEHGARYAGFASALAAQGYAVYADDHRGHGLSVRSAEDLGWFAERAGWQRVVDDLWQLNRKIAEIHPGLPIAFFGHSMGSFLGQQFMSEHGAALAAVVLCASNGPPGPRATLGRLVAQLERYRLGPKGRSALLNQMSFGEFNKPFQPARTAFDWLSRDPAAVDSYIADPLCGFVCGTDLWVELLTALPKLATPEALARIPKGLPILVIAGTKDPVSAGTRGLMPLFEAYKKAGLERVEHIFYADARHEILNETNREQVIADVIDWLARQFRV